MWKSSPLFLDSYLIHCRLEDGLSASSLFSGITFTLQTNTILKTSYWYKDECATNTCNSVSAQQQVYVSNEIYWCQVYNTENMDFTWANSSIKASSVWPHQGLYPKEKNIGAWVFISQPYVETQIFFLRFGNAQSNDRNYRKTINLKKN